MFETEVVIRNDNIELSGTLCLPKESGSFPIVLMVHGSGDIDRNENSKNQKLNIFNSIAHDLVKDCIASLRYDKRGIGRSNGDFYTAGHYDLVNEAMACLEYLFQNKYCDSKQIYLLGHSEGSIIVPQLSQKYSEVAGIILLAPFIDNLETIMLKQAKGIKEASGDLSGIKGIVIKLLFSFNDPVRSQLRLISKIKKTTKTVVYSMFQKIPAKWVRELLSIDPSDIFRKTTCPSLIIGGSKDIQCNPDDVTSIQKIMQGTVESHIIQDMSHILRLEKEEPTVFNYEKLIKQPIDPKLTKIIKAWINR